MTQNELAAGSFMLSAVGMGTMAGFSAAASYGDYHFPFGFLFAAILFGIASINMACQAGEDRVEEQAKAKRAARVANELAKLFTSDTRYVGVSMPEREQEFPPL